MQVGKDRQNWAGKMPKRQLFHGAPSPFDWEGESRKIQEAKEQNLERTTSSASESFVIASGTESDYCPTVPPAQVKKKTPTTAPAAVSPVQVEGKGKGKIGLDCLKTCFECRVAVWVGPPDAVAAGVALACPPNTDWSQSNQQPYCSVCWAEENSFLATMASGHKVRPARKIYRHSNYPVPHPNSPIPHPNSINRAKVKV